jgi:hypothetical protein
MKYQFYGYEVRSTSEADLALAIAWTTPANPRFWIEDSWGYRRQNFIVLRNGEPLGFFQKETVSADQVRLHMQASPAASPKKILRGITMLVPLIEKALALSGVKHIFFTSKSAAMAAFMADKMKYHYAGRGDIDGMVMVKAL